MLKPWGFSLMLLLGLAAGINADWNFQRSPFISNVRSRAYLPPRPDPGNCLTDLYRTAVPLILSTSETPCQRITHSWNSTNQVPCSVSKTRAATFTYAFFMKEALSDFRFSHNDTSLSKAKYSHQIIVIMEEDPTVIESATYLYERHSTVSALLRYKKGALHRVTGSHLNSTRPRYVTLVGHGSKSTDGTAQLAGFGSEELATFVSTLKTELIIGHLDTVSLISCKLGNDLQFILRLLQVLKSRNIKTKLHLYDSFLSVSSEGNIMTRTNGVWKSHDHSRRVIAELDQGGNLLTKVELGCTGKPVFPEYKGRVLYLQTLEWPNHPQMFVPVELRKRYFAIDCLEGLTWSLFFEENERRRAPDYVPDNQKHLKPVWLTEPQEDNIVFKHIVTIQDLLVEIRYNAREEVSSDIYYVLNECIYKMKGNILNVCLVGKFMSTDNQAEIESFQQNFGRQQDKSSLHELREGLKASKFNDFCRQTFQFQQCSYNCERWGHYFMVAVFSSSVRNFRTFSLFLMSVIGCEVGRSRGTDSSLCTAFVGDGHPMVTEQPWPEHFRRGFYGGTIENYELAPQDRQIWLDEVVAKENALYVKSKQLMNGLYRDEQTELDIFGRVKVMNKYVFSSYLEFFRGTPEGKQLKRGCAPHFSDKSKP